MRRATTTTQMLVRASFVVQLVLGVLFWTGNALDLVPLHQTIGFLLVFGLWTLAGLAARAGVRPPLVALAAVWGLIVPILGLTQTRLLVGSAHWLIEVLHLLVGLGAIGLAENLAARIKERLAAVA
ncbi:MAG TPA: hypothetical protein VFU54_13765 [Actinomycetota bacterium]|nr:hypothetical protein [Actinomycetota bacterium]